MANGSEADGESEPSHSQCLVVGLQESLEVAKVEERGEGRANTTIADDARTVLDGRE
jgi:hypothetical protein